MEATKRIENIQIRQEHELALRLKELADKEERSISKMGAILLREALERREQQVKA